MPNKKTIPYGLFVVFKFLLICVSALLFANLIHLKHFPDSFLFSHFSAYVNRSVTGWVQFFQLSHSGFFVVLIMIIFSVFKKGVR